jgi:hypothetical protein
VGVTWDATSCASKAHSPIWIACLVSSVATRLPAIVGSIQAYATKLSLVSGLPEPLQSSEFTFLRFWSIEKFDCSSRFRVKTDHS